MIVWCGEGKNNSYLCKRKQAGGVQFSRDPLNLTNKHSRKHAGFANEKAIGIHPDSNTVRSPPIHLPPFITFTNVLQDLNDDQTPQPPKQTRKVDAAVQLQRKHAEQEVVS
jgi:hypothetical protein